MDTMRYRLNDLLITTVGDPATFNCSHMIGDGLVVKGENISFKPGTKQFSHYALASLMPYIAAKQRVTDERDWMFFESEIACPDPACSARFHFEITGHSDYEYTPPSAD
jgi:uncharacterized repeat protein (TIGR04076 family)